MLAKLWFIFGALQGALTVAMGAVAAHALPPAAQAHAAAIASAVQIQGLHALALLVVSQLVARCSRCGATAFGKERARGFAPGLPPGRSRPGPAIFWKEKRGANSSDVSTPRMRPPFSLPEVGVWGLRPQRVQGRALAFASKCDCPGTGWGRGLTHVAAASMALGSVLFCGAIYGHDLLGWPVGGAAPFGGVLLILSWLILAASAVPAR